MLESVVKQDNKEEESIHYFRYGYFELHEIKLKLLSLSQGCPIEKSIDFISYFKVFRKMKNEIQAIKCCHIKAYAYCCILFWCWNV